MRQSVYDTPVNTVISREQTNDDGRSANIQTSMYKRNMRLEEGRARAGN